MGCAAFMDVHPAAAVVGVVDMAGMAGMEAVADTAEVAGVQHRRAMSMGAGSTPTSMAAVLAVSALSTVVPDQQ